MTIETLEAASLQMEGRASAPVLFKIDGETGPLCLSKVSAGI